jgi:hypothetical protein
MEDISRCAYPGTGGNTSCPGVAVPLMRISRGFKDHFKVQVRSLDQWTKIMSIQNLSKSRIVQSASSCISRFTTAPRPFPAATRSGVRP